MSRHNPEAERAALGGVLLHQATWPLAAALAAPEDFFDPTAALAWRACAAVASRGAPIEPALVGAAMGAEGERAAAAVAWLEDALVHAPADADGVAECARLVAGLAVVRRIEADALGLAARAREPGVEPEELAAELARAAAAATSSATRTPAVDGHAMVGEFWEKLERRMAAGCDPDALTTGLADLDAILDDGLRPQHLVLVAARPGSGKTSLGLGLAVAAARAGQRVYFASLEMPRSELAERYVAARARVPLPNVRRMQGITQPDMDRMVAAGADLAGLPILWDDTSDMTLTELRARVLSAHAVAPLGMVVVDYVQLLKAPRSASRERTREREVSEVATGLAALAKELRVRVVGLAQINRAAALGADKRPTMAHLRESGDLESAANTILLLHRPECYDPHDRPGEADIIVAKQRGGRTGDVVVAWDGPATTFADLGASRGAPGGRATPPPPSAEVGGVTW